MKYIKRFENTNNEKIIYPYNQIKYFVDWFQNFFSKKAEEQGWGIFDSDTSQPLEKYISDSGKYQRFWQIESIDELELLKSDLDADKLAKKMGLMLDEYGLVIGYNGISFLDNPKSLDIYKDMSNYNL
jgi:hypothetical protein